MSGSNRFDRTGISAFATQLGYFGAALGIAFAIALAAAGQNPDQPEVTTQESEPGFILQSQQNLVQVNVVVRDARGRPAGNLRQEDFRVLDNGKPQIISHFSVEKAGETQATESEHRPASPESKTVSAAPSPQSERNTALFFDDLHMDFEGAVRTREAALRYVKTALRPGDRAGIFTASGRAQLDFTDNRDDLQTGLEKIQPRSIFAQSTNSCPDISDYEAYLMMEEHDPTALDLSTLGTAYCRGCVLDPQGGAGLVRVLPNGILVPCDHDEMQQAAEGKAREILAEYEGQSVYTLRAIAGVVRGMATLRGQRSVVLVSPGFLTFRLAADLGDIVERALRFHIVINAMDSQGLYTPPTSDASTQTRALAPLTTVAGANTARGPSQPSPSQSGKPAWYPQVGSTIALKTRFAIAGVSQKADILSDFASGTGGTFFHNSNDFDEGFRKTGALPEVYYVLAFTPDHLKPDGSFHTLKVSLVNGGHLDIQARRGYYATKSTADAATRAHQELQDTVFTKQQFNEIPIQVRTEFFKPENQATKFSVITHVDVAALRFRKAGDRNQGGVTVVTALFDMSGKYVIGRQRVLEFHLHDASLQRLLKSGVDLKTSVDLKSGSYLMREVVRDDAGAQMSALNRSIEIP